MTMSSKQDETETRKGTTELQAFVSILKGNVGPGALSLPYAFSKAGYLLAPMGVAIIGFTSIYNMATLVKCKASLERKGVKSFGDVGYQALGAFGSRLIEFFIVATQLGVCCVYFEFISTNVFAMLPDDVDISKRVLVLATMPLALALSLPRTLSLLAPFTSLATISVVVAVAVVVGYACSSLLQDGVGEMKNGTPLPAMSWSEAPLYFGNVVFSFEGIGIVLPVENSMANPSRFPSLLIGTMLLVTLIFVVLGQICYLAFGEIESGSITAELSDHGFGWPVTFINVLICVAVLLTLYPAVEILEKHLTSNNSAHVESTLPLLTSDGTNIEVGIPNHKLPLVKSWLLRLTLVLLTGGLAAGVSQLGLIVSLFGSVGCSILALILPPILHVRLVPTLPMSIKAFESVVLCFGLVGSVMGTYQSTTAIIQNM